jgi:hypothetical protein
MAIVTKSQMTSFDSLTLWQSLGWGDPRSYANSHTVVYAQNLLGTITVQQLKAVLPLRFSLGLYIQQSEHVLLISLIPIEVS